MKTHAIARFLVASGFALASLLSVAASAAVSADVVPAPVQIDWNAIMDTANQTFTFD